MKRSRVGVATQDADATTSSTTSFSSSLSSSSNHIVLSRSLRVLGRQPTSTLDLEEHEEVKLQLPLVKFICGAQTLGTGTLFVTTR